MKEQDNRTEPANHPRPLERCKVCTKQIHAGEDSVKVFHGSTTYLTCCVSCAAKFEVNPGAYLVT